MVIRRILQRAVVFASVLCVLNAVLLFCSLNFRSSKRPHSRSVSVMDERPLREKNTRDSEHSHRGRTRHMNPRLVRTKVVAQPPEEVEVYAVEGFDPRSSEHRYYATREQLCAETGKRSRLVIIAVVSKPGNVAYRRAVQSSWARPDTLENARGRYAIRVVYFVPKCADGKIEPIHGDATYDGDTDVISTNCSDAGTALEIFGWIERECAGASFLLIVDDRSVVMQDNLLRFLNLKNDRGVYVRSEQFLKPERNGASKLSGYGKVSTTVKSFENEYISCGHLLVSRDVIKTILGSHNRTKIPVHDRFALDGLSRRSGISISSDVNLEVKSTSDFCELADKLTLIGRPVEVMYGAWTRYLKLSATFCDLIDTTQVTFRVKQDDEILTHKVKFVRNSPYACFAPVNANNAEGNTFVFMLIMSDQTHQHERSVLRQSWAGLSEVNGQVVSRLFVLSVPEHPVNDSKLITESETHRDMLILRLDGDPRNKTLKLMTAIKWTTLYCPNVKYILLTKDNTFMHIPNLVEHLKHAPRSQLVLGAIDNTTKPNRKAMKPGFLSNFDWSAEFLPPYPNPSAYVISADVGSLLLRQFSKENFWDVSTGAYLGLLLHGLGIQPRSTHLFQNYYDGGRICLLSKLISVNPMSATKMYRAWRGTSEWGEYLKCDAKVGLFLNDISRSALKRVFEQKSPKSSNGYHHDYNFPMNEPDKCKTDFRSNKTSNTTSEDPIILVGIMTAPYHTKEREAIRKTWADRTYTSTLNDSQITTVFFVGKPKLSTVQRELEEESAKHGDIVQADFSDTYRNLTMKTVSLMKWATRYCDCAHYVIKADDDVIINWPNMIRLLSTAPRSMFYLGDSRIGSRPLRDARDKWFTPEEAWPYATYPPYNSGQVYIVSSDVARISYYAALGISLFPWEDVFMGALLSRLSIFPTPHSAFDNVNRLMRTPCGFQSCLSSHDFKPSVLLDHWNKLRACDEAEQHCECPKDDFFGRKIVKPFPDRMPHLADLSAKRLEVSQQLYQKMEIFELDLILNNPTLCLNDKGVDILIIVSTPPQNYDKRKFIRLTWANYDVIDNRRVEVLFFTGKASDSITQNFVVNEHSVHNDVIQASFLDYKTHEMHKTAFSLRWAATFCGCAKVVVQVRDDLFVNTPNLVTFLEHREHFNETGEYAYTCSGDNCACGPVGKNPSNRAHQIVYNFIYIVSGKALQKISDTIKDSLDIEKALHGEGVRVHSSTTFDPIRNILEVRKIDDNINVCDLHDIIVSRAFTGNDVYAIGSSFYERKNNFFDCKNTFTPKNVAVCTVRMP